MPQDKEADGSGRDQGCLAIMVMILPTNSISDQTLEDKIKCLREIGWFDMEKWAAVKDPNSLVGLLIGGKDGVPGSGKGMANHTQKARKLWRTARMLKERRWRVPRTRKEMEGLAGVGPKVSCVLGLVLFGEDWGFPVDSHCFKICRLLLWCLLAADKDEPRCARRVEQWTMFERKTSKAFLCELNLLFAGLGQSLTAKTGKADQFVEKMLWLKKNRQGNPLNAKLLDWPVITARSNHCWGRDCEDKFATATNTNTRGLSVQTAQSDIPSLLCCWLPVI